MSKYNFIKKKKKKYIYIKVDIKVVQLIVCDSHFYF